MNVAYKSLSSTSVVHVAVELKTLKFVVGGIFSPVTERIGDMRFDAKPAIISIRQEICNDSLNVGVAFGIMAYDIRNKFLAGKP